MIAVYLGLVTFANFALISLIYGKLIMGETWKETFDGLKFAAIAGVIVTIFGYIG